MAKVLFVDDRLAEIQCQWQESGCGIHHELLPLEPFDSIERTCSLVHDFQPNVVVIGYGLSKYPTTGSDVIQALRKQGYCGFVVANSGGGIEQFKHDNIEVDGSVDRVGRQLHKVMTTLFQKGC